MAKAITVNDADITVIEPQARFGLRHCRRTGDIVRVLDTYTLARFNLGDGTAVYREICDTCRGTGFRPEFAGVFGGECFPCRGAGVLRKACAGSPLDLVRAMRRRQQAQTRRASARRDMQQARLDAHGAWLAANADLADMLARVRAAAEIDPNDRTFSPLLRDLACQAVYRILTPARCALAQKMYDEGVQARQRRQQAAAQREWLGATGEKVTFTGTLVYTNHVWKNFGAGDRASTLYILADGATGARVKWWRSGYWTPEHKGVYTLTGTIKELEADATYGKCTVLTRCKIEEREAVGV